MDKRKLEKLSRPVTNVYLAIEEQMLLNIAKKIATDNSLLSEVEIDDNPTQINSWQVSQLSQLDSLESEQIDFIAKKSGVVAEEIEKMLKEAGYSAVNEIEGELSEAAGKGKLLKPPDDARDSAGLQQLLQGYERQAKNVMNLTNTTLINQSKEKHLQVVNETVGKVLSGVTSPQQALKESIRKLANTGMPALIDKGGKQWSAEAYVNMVMRSTSNNVANGMQDFRMDEYGQDLVEISVSGGARPKCAPYQGRIFSRSGNDKKYPALSSTSMGDAAGLFGVNCSHVKFPYFEGTKKTYEPPNKKENDRIYKESQEQRALERVVRKAKREMAMMDAIDSKEGIIEAEQKVKEAQTDLLMFTKKTNRTRRYSREQIH